MSRARLRDPGDSNRSDRAKQSFPQPTALPTAGLPLAGPAGGLSRCSRPVVLISALPSPTLPWPQGLHSLDLQEAGPQRQGFCLPRMGNLCHLPKASYAPEEMVGYTLLPPHQRMSCSLRGTWGWREVCQGVSDEGHFQINPVSNSCSYCPR